MYHNQQFVSPACVFLHLSARARVATGAFTNIPVGRQVYVLKAEVQCNGGTGMINITSPQISSIQNMIVQPPVSCSGSCDSYSSLVSGVDVTSLMTSATFSFGASVDKVGPDLCMAGQHLKVVFTLQYSRS